MSRISIISNPVHSGVTIGSEERSVTSTVFCQRRGHLVPLAACTACPHLVSVPENPAKADAAVQCRGAEKLHGYLQADFIELTARTMVGELMRQRFACVEADGTWETLEGLLIDEELDAVTVIDSNGRPIGIVSKTDLLRRARDGVEEVDASSVLPGEPGLHIDVRPRSVAGDVMTRVVHTLPENAPVSFAIALIALENIDQVPVVSDAGKVVGLFASRDALRWIAQQMGYVVKPPGS